MEKVMRNDRLYKSLSLKDFMEQLCFVVAKGGLYLVPLVQESNYERTFEKMKAKTDDELKVCFVDKAIRLISATTTNIRITDAGSFYDVWTELTE